MVATTAHARSGYTNVFRDRYPGATNIDTCGLCHRNFNSNSPRNTYGNDFNNRSGSTNDKLRLIENLDSDGDGTSNIDEIMFGDGFYPGWDCDNLDVPVNAPNNLADLVDPTNVGCLDGFDICDINCSGDVTVTDALIVLRRTVDLEDCTCNE